MKIYNPLDLNPLEVSATASTSAPTGTAALISGMTSTPAAGTYLVVYTGAHNSASSGSTCTYSLFVGGVQKADSIRIISPFAGGTLSATNAGCGIALNGLVTVNGAQAIEVRWVCSGGTNTTIARTLNLVRVI